MNDPRIGLLTTLLATVDGEPPDLRVIDGPLASLRAHRASGAVAVHPLGAPVYRPGWRTRVRDQLRGTAVVEPVRQRTRVIDDILGACGARLAGPIRAGFGTATATALTSDGEQLIVRAGRGAAEEAAALRHLPPSVPSVPKVVGAGVNHDVAWVLETRLTGTQPRVVSPALVHDALRFLATLPRSSDPILFDRDIAVLHGVRPHLEHRIDALHSALQQATAGVGGVMRHGDFWAGNLLCEGDHITGVVDWDAWQASAMPGTDVLHLVATAERHRRRVGIGAVFLRQPWRDPSVRDLLAAGASSVDRDAVAAAWWLAHTASDIRRVPAFGVDAAWLHTNVDTVLASRVLLA